jgi:RNA polymerase sigma-70 factor, ECF subfamily
LIGDPLAEDQLRRARAGDAFAFGELLAPVLDPGFRLAMTMLKDRNAAEDAVQEAALKSWRKLDRFRYGAASGRGSWRSSPTSAALSGALGGGR